MTSPLRHCPVQIPLIRPTWVLHVDEFHVWWDKSWWYDQVCHFFFFSFEFWSAIIWDWYTAAIIIFTIANAKLQWITNVYSEMKYNIRKHQVTYQRMILINKLQYNLVAKLWFVSNLSAENFTQVVITLELIIFFLIVVMGVLLVKLYCRYYWRMCIWMLLIMLVL